MDDVTGSARSASKARESRLYKKKTGANDNTAIFGDDEAFPLKNSVKNQDIQLTFDFPKIDKDSIKFLEPNTDQTSKPKISI